MNILILAAGYGTRLYPLTLKVPKPLIPINDTPIINFLIEKVEKLKRKVPIEEIKIVSSNKFYKNFLIWKKQFNVEADILNDGSNSPDDRLGAIKDISFSIGGKKADWLVLGGDNLFEDDLSDFLKFSLDRRPFPCIGLYDVKCKKAATRFGVVILNKRKRVVKLEEKPKEPSSTLAASCVYFFPEQSVDFLDLFISRHDNIDASGKYIEWLAQKTKVFGYTLKGKWIDIGHFDSLKVAEKEFDGNKLLHIKKTCLL